MIVRNLLRCLSVNIKIPLNTGIFTRHKTSYDGEGKSTANIINFDVDLGIMIDAISTIGFRLNNGTSVIGPLVLFHRSILSWNIRKAADINEESLSLFKVLEPKVDFVVLGLGDRSDTKEVFPNVMQVCKRAKINAEILPTEAACSTFNFLNSEGRNVAALLLPPRTLRIPEADVVLSNVQLELDEQVLEKEGRSRKIYIKKKIN